ncbi:Tankyrase-2 [Phytophthora megakarya]|uniref:Tankyrase-2 n=1 Tax=Phytophthora megakarya TaxID=4795 RepID=A0A225UWQ2_9STRA|nr:Tankyrase-2 [Phytophthora megakarya]
MWSWTITDYVRAGDPYGVLYRLDAGDSIEERRSSNYTPLINAAYYNKCQMIKLLLAKGADIEAVDKSGLSALRTAIYYRNEEAAILLAKRGADANKIAYQQKTALHAAVKDGQLAVVRALLVNGADLTIKSESTGQTAIDYANSEALKNLLAEFVSLQMAIEAESYEAVSVWLKKTLSGRDNADDVLTAYQTVMTAVATAEGYWQTVLQQLVGRLEVDMLYRAAQCGSSTFVDAIDKTVDKPEWTINVSLNSKGWNVLHVAVSHGRMNLVNHLLTNYCCDFTALDFEGNTASDLVSGKEDESSKHIYWILSQHEKKTKFIELSSQIMLREESMKVNIHELPRYMALGIKTCLQAASPSLVNSFSELTSVSPVTIASADSQASKAKLMVPSIKCPPQKNIHPVTSPISWRRRIRSPSKRIFSSSAFLSIL